MLNDYEPAYSHDTFVVIFCGWRFRNGAAMDFFTTGTRAIISLERSLTLGSIEEAEGDLVGEGGLIDSPYLVRDMWR